MNSFYHEIDWTQVATNWFFWIAILGTVLMAVIGWSKLYASYTRRKGFQIKNRFNYGFVRIVAAAFAVGIVVLSHVESPAGWSQLSINGLSASDGTAWAFILVMPALTLMAAGALFCFYMFVCFGFVEAHRQWIRTGQERAKEKL
ncbi:MAG: hypothetical protein LBL84_00265, partial [Candidatus Nomurabacteria bacterium]|nr:hypothetical protein [Candidatus Nomurabacteria bacterium]